MEIRIIKRALFITAVIFCLSIFFGVRSLNSTEDTSFGELVHIGEKEAAQAPLEVSEISPMSQPVERKDVIQKPLKAREVEPGAPANKIFRSAHVQFEYPAGYTARQTLLSEMGIGMEMGEYPQVKVAEEDDELIGFSMSNEHNGFHYSEWREGLEVGEHFSYRPNEGLRAYNSYSPDKPIISSFEAFESNMLLEQVGPENLGIYLLFPDIRNGIYFESQLGHPYSKEEYDVLLMQYFDGTYLSSGNSLFPTDGRGFIYFTCKIQSLADAQTCIKGADIFLSSSVDIKKNGPFFTSKSAPSKPLSFESIKIGPIPNDLLDASNTLIEAIEARDIRALNSLIVPKEIVFSPRIEFFYDSSSMRPYSGKPLNTLGQEMIYEWGENSEAHHFIGTLSDFFDNFSLKGDEWEKAHISYSDSRASHLVDLEGKWDDQFVTLEYFLEPSVSNGNDWKANRFYFKQDEEGEWKLLTFTYTDQRQADYERIKKELR